jgi:hypothetical protein
MEELIRIPDDLAFAELCLRRDAGTGVLTFSSTPLGRLCIHNDLNLYEVLADEDKSMNLICRWYLAHLVLGGPHDEVLQDVLGEMGLAGWIAESRKALEGLTAHGDRHGCHEGASLEQKE